MSITLAGNADDNLHDRITELQDVYQDRRFSFDADLAAIRGNASLSSEQFKQALRACHNQTNQDLKAIRGQIAELHELRKARAHEIAFSLQDHDWSNLAWPEAQRRFQAGYADAQKTETDFRVMHLGFKALGDTASSAISILRGKPSNVPLDPASRKQHEQRQRELEMQQQQQLDAAVKQSLTRQLKEAEAAADYARRRGILNYLAGARHDDVIRESLTRFSDPSLIYLFKIRGEKPADLPGAPTPDEISLGTQIKEGWNSFRSKIFGG